MSTNLMWKERPPGAEQLLLEEMFENGSILSSATPEAVRQSSDIFKQFSSRVFAAHFRKTKAKMGEFGEASKFLCLIFIISNELFVSVSHARIPQFSDGVIPLSVDLKNNPAKGIGQIAELGFTDTSALKRHRLDQLEVPAVVEVINPPFTLWRYTDHVSKNDHICVTINSPTGTKSVSFDVSEDGMKLIVKFPWAPAIHDAKKMFNEKIRAREIDIQHPMLHALSSTLLDSGITETSTTETQMIIPLPCRVRREVSSYSMSKLTYENTLMVFIKLAAYQNVVIIEHANRTMSLE